MSPEAYCAPEFIRRHCGSVAIEAPSDRATGAQRQRRWRRSIFRKPIGFHSYHPRGQVFPRGMRLSQCQLRSRRKCYDL